MLLKIANFITYTTLTGLGFLLGFGLVVNIWVAIGWWTIGVFVILISMGITISATVRKYVDIYTKAVEADQGITISGRPNLMAEDKEHRERWLRFINQSR